MTETTSPFIDYLFFFQAVEREDGLEVIDIYADCKSSTDLTVSSVIDYLSQNVKCVS